jgi:EAL domain-containing protein (putative c-di-GMP-specific phosphodiesterase class I)
MEAIAHGLTGTALEDPAAWRAEVVRCHAEIQSDRAALSAAVLKASLPQGASLSIRVHATTLECDAAFPEFAAAICDTRGLPLSRLVLGISHQPRFVSEGAFFLAVERLRAAGVRIALDDVGAGGLRQRLLAELRPDFYKLDPALIHGDRRRARALIESVLQLAAKSGGRVVAQGIETESDLDTAVAAGVELLQGPHLLLPPSPPAIWVMPEAAGVYPHAYPDCHIR